MSIDSQTTVANRHDYDTTYTNEWDQDQTALTILTPTSGYCLKVAGVHVSGEATSGQIRVYFPTSGNSLLVAFGGASGVLQADDTMVMKGTTDEPIKITSTFGADKNFFISIDYKEELL